MKKRNKRFYIIYILNLLGLCALSSFSFINNENLLIIVSSYLLACELTRGE